MEFTSFYRYLQLRLAVLAILAIAVPSFSDALRPQGAHAQAVPVVQDGFESGNWSGGSGWSGAWTSTSGAAISTSGPQSGARLAMIRGSGSISRAVSLRGYSSATLTYWARSYSFELFDRTQVQVSTNGSSWTTLRTHANGEDDNRYRQYSINLSPYVNATTVYLRFDGQMSSSSSDYFYVDSISIAVTGSAPAPSPTSTPSPTPSPTQTRAPAASPTPSPTATQSPTQPPAATATPTPTTTSADKRTSTIVIDGQQNVVIENVHITTTSGPCISIRNASNITIRNAEIGPCGGNGIVIQTSSGVEVRNSFVHPEYHTGVCCDKGNGILAIRSSSIVVKDSVIAYGESNLELLGVQGVQVVNNLLVNPVGPFPRGAQVQVWSHEGARSSNVRIEGNYALATRNGTHAHTEGQTDAFNFGFVDGVVVKGNYMTGGIYRSGCAILAEMGANSVQILDNTLLEIGQCGIGIAGGGQQTVRGNKIYSHGITGNAGNVAIYVWNQTSSPCGPVEVSGNTAVLIRPDGSYQYNSFWNGGGCQLTLGTNVFGQKALDALTPTSSTMPSPVNIWSHWLQ